MAGVIKINNIIHEECGVFGIYAATAGDVAGTVRTGLYALQHRGQESCGIAVNSDGQIKMYKDLGLVSEVLTPAAMQALGTGTMAVGHVRYGTTGNSGRENAQPIMINHLTGSMAVVHNGNLVNAYQLRQQLEENGSIFHTTSDSEIIAYVITRERINTHNAENAVLQAMEQLEGAYSLVLLFEDRLIAVRDKQGFRPLCYGRSNDGDYIIASESCALDATGATFIRDIEPGEMIVFDANGIHSNTQNCNKAAPARCIFEFIYFARPDSRIDGSSVHRARLNAGRFLAKEHPVAADIVIGVPDSGIDAAIGYSMESGIPYGIGFIKNKYIGRTFIAPGQNKREKMVRIKLNPVADTVRGQRVVMIDDSIVRGTTSAAIVRLLREAGAAEIHVRITAPPFRYPCFYGTDIDSQSGLIAYQHSIDEICQLIGADSLGYLNLDYLPRLIGEDSKRSYCSACFDGLYPTATPGEKCRNMFESKATTVNRDSK